MSVLDPRDIRRAAASAGLLASDKAGERAAAAFALCRILLKGGLDPASVISAGLEAVTSMPRAITPSPMPSRYPSGPLRPLSERARMARYSPHINDYERGFLNDIMDRRNLSVRQESLLKAILRKSEGPGQ